MEKIPVRHINTKVKEPDFLSSFKIRKVENLLSGEDMVQALHRHSFFYILLIEKGSGVHYIDFVEYPVTNFSIFFMRPGQVHKLTLDRGSVGYLMEFASDFYSPLEQSGIQILRKVSSKNYCQLDVARFSKLLFLLNYIFQEYSAREDKFQEVIKASLDIFFIELVRQSRNPQNSGGKGSQYMQDRLEELLELITFHVANHKQVSDYAQMLNLTAYQLNAITKSTLDKTCSELINEYIILEAKRYLLATGNQINQIAYHLGYEDVSYFIRFFKKHVGASPEIFRHNFK
ncbi:helix-turn-helix domain-containing protein [Dyadobacter diqingensis]|uniref:helix-turn-helix domain-containing protein n=1 Tax=Dyadobacter diqingensis TaxID=2938121 RepID=UPI0020C4BCC9|nr:AraC family transcriptional regulator [Dyadobacter diqingensis]